MQAQETPILLSLDDQKVEDVKNKVGAVMDIVDQVKKLLDKINKK